MNVETMSRAELELEIISNDELYKYFGGDKNLINTANRSDEEIRDKIRAWIIQGDETFQG